MVLSCCGVITSLYICAGVWFYHDVLRLFSYFLCSCHDVMWLRCYVVWYLLYVVLSLRDVVSSLRDVVSSLCDVVSSLCLLILSCDTKL